jgi:hypothetical protein
MAFQPNELDVGKGARADYHRPPGNVVCYAWPETNGLWGNVWELKSWGKPYTGYVPLE